MGSAAAPAPSCCHRRRRNGAGPGPPPRGCKIPHLQSNDRAPAGGHAAPRTAQQLSLLYWVEGRKVSAPAMSPPCTDPAGETGRPEPHFGPEPHDCQFFALWCRRAGWRPGSSRPRLDPKRRRRRRARRSRRTQALLTPMFCICSSSTRSPPAAFFLPPSCCFFCFLESSCSMGAGFTKRMICRRSAGRTEGTDCSPRGSPGPAAPHPRGTGGSGSVQGATWGHEVPQPLGDDDALLGLVVLQDGADGSGGGTHRGVEHVHKLHLRQVDASRGGHGGTANGERGTRPPSPTSSPCPSSSWSARSGCASGAPGSRCSWSRTRAHGTLLSLGTKPPSPASCWQRGSGRLVGSRAAVRGCSHNAPHCGMQPGVKAHKVTSAQRWVGGSAPAWQSRGRKEPQRGHIFKQEPLGLPLSSRGTVGMGQRGAPQRVSVLVSPSHG